jgi:hypothetical protein
MLETGGVYIGLKEGKVKGVGQSGKKIEGENLPGHFVGRIYAS